MVTRRISSWLLLFFSLHAASCSWCGCYAYKLMEMWTSFEWSAFFFLSAPLSFCLFILIVFLNYNDSWFFVLSLECVRARAFTHSPALCWSSVCSLFSFLIGHRTHWNVCTNGTNVHSHQPNAARSTEIERMKICIPLNSTNSWQFTNRQN